MNLDGPDPRWRDVAAILLGPLVPKLRGGGETPVAVAVPVTAPAAPHAAAPVGAAGTTPAVPARQPYGPAPIVEGHGAGGSVSPYERAGAAGPEQPGARPVPTTAGSCGEAGQPPERAGAPGDAPAPPIGLPRGGIMIVRWTDRRRLAAGRMPSERGGIGVWIVRGRRGVGVSRRRYAAPPLGYEPRWYCITCSDGHIGPCTALTQRRRPMLLRLLDLIGRPA